MSNENRLPVSAILLTCLVAVPNERGTFMPLPLCDQSEMLVKSLVVPGAAMEQTLPNSSYLAENYTDGPS